MGIIENPGFLERSWCHASYTTTKGQLALRMLYKGCCHISIVLTFSFDRRKRFQYAMVDTYFLKTEQKSPYFRNIWLRLGQGLKLTFNCWKLSEVKITTILRRSTKNITKNETQVAFSLSEFPMFFFFLVYLQ